MAFLKKTAQMTFLKKKHDQKHSVMQSLGAIALMEAMYCTQLCYFFCETQLCYLLSAVLNKEQKRIGWNDGARNRVWEVLLFAFVDVSHRKQNDKKLIKLEPASRKQYLKMRG